MKPPKFSFNVEAPPEPSAIDRLAAEVDPDAAERVRRYDEWLAHQKKVERFMKKLGEQTRKQIIAAQPMTNPLSGIDFFRPRYGKPE